MKDMDEKRMTGIARKQEKKALTQDELKTLQSLISKKKVERENGKKAGR